MSNFINQIKGRFSIVTAVLIIGIGSTAACTSAVSEKTGGGSGAANVESKTATVENKNAPPKPTTEAVTNKETDGLPAFKKGEDYKTSVRVKMLKDGWKPARTENADLCGSGDSTCDEFPEMENCAGTGLGNCKFRWQRAGKIAAIFTVGESHVYDGSEFEKASKTVAAAPDEKWQSFWTEFKTAFDKQDASSLRKMMADDFFDGGGGGTASQWVDSIEKNNSWAMNKKSIAGGTKIGKCENPCRSTKDGYLLFEYKNGKWLWTGLGGEGGD